MPDNLLQSGRMRPLAGLSLDRSHERAQFVGQVPPEQPDPPPQLLGASSTVNSCPRMAVAPSLSVTVSEIG